MVKLNVNHAARGANVQDTLYLKFCTSVLYNYDVCFAVYGSTLDFSDF